ncbi:MAG: DUF2795 domain-containing protein [Armatimonadota bacterium]
MVDASDIYKALKGINYPASKDDILDYAHSKRAPEDVIEKLTDLDSEYYNSIDEVYNQFGIEDCVSISESE